MQRELTLQEQVLLLCLNDETGMFEEPWGDHAVEGAALAELLLRDRIGLDDKNRVVVRDAVPVDDPLLDRVLSRISEDSKAHGVADWIGWLYRGKFSARQALLDRLMERGLLTESEGRFLWVFPQKKYPAADSGPEQAVREQIRAAVTGEGPVEPRLASLIALLRGADSLDRVFSRDELKRCESRLRSIADGTAVSKAGGKAVQDAVWRDLAIIGAITAGAAAASAAS